MKPLLLTVVFLLQLYINNAVQNTTKHKLKRSIEPERTYYLMGGLPPKKDFPFVVSLQYPPLYHFCSGSIITRKHVITAAHCFCEGEYYKPKEEILIAAGSENLMDEEMDYYTVAHTICHPEYNNLLQYHDIGILETKKFFQFSDTISYVSIYNSDIPIEKNQVIIPGWGSSSESSEVKQFLYYIEVKTYSRNTCLKLLRKIDLDEYFMDWNFCTYNHHKKACSMDSGGPVLFEDGVLGIVSWSDGCTEGVPDVHTSIPDHLDWIVENTRYDI